MDLDYSKWDKMLNEDTSEGSGAEGKASSGGRHGSSGGGTSGCRDPSCCNCGPEIMSGFFNSFPEHLADMPLMDKDLPEVGSAPDGASGPTFTRGTIRGSDTTIVASDPVINAAAKAAFARCAAENGMGFGGGDGHAASAGENDGDDPDVPSLESVTESEDEDDEDDKGERENGSSSDSDPSGDDGEESSEGPPALNSSSDSDFGEDVVEPSSTTLFEEFRRARRNQLPVSADYWKDEKNKINPKFVEFFRKVLGKRSCPEAGSALRMSKYPIGFAEFVCFVGEADQARLKAAAGEDFPVGFLEFARVAAGQNTRAHTGKTQLSMQTRDDMTEEERSDHVVKATTNEEKKRAAREKNRRASEQARKLSDRTKAPRAPNRSKAPAGVTGKDAKNNGKGPFGDGSCAAVAKTLRRNFESASKQRREAGAVAIALEDQVRTALRELDMALAREKLRNDNDLAAQRAAVETARAATAEATAAAAEAEAAALGGQSRESLSVKEALERAEGLKKRANAILLDTRYPAAVEQYTLGVKVLEPHVISLRRQQKSGGNTTGDSGEEGSKEKGGGGARSDGEEDERVAAARELLLILLCNRSLAHLKWGNLGSAKQDAQQAMDIDPHHIKAYFRRAAAHKQAERYREALSDLRYMLRLEPPPKKGVPVSDDILAVQKMARECEQKLRAKGFKKALEETTKAKTTAKTGSAQKQAREAWDAERSKGINPGKKRMPRPPARKGCAAAVWETEAGAAFLPPNAKIPTLKDQAACTAAAIIDRAPEAYVHWCEGLLSEYLLCVFERLGWVSLQTMMSSGLYDEVGMISSNAQTNNWQAQDRQYRRLYAAVSHEDFLEAQAVSTGSDAGKSVGVRRSQLLSSEVLDPHLGLVDVLENHSLFNHQAWDAEERATPKLFNFNASRSTGRAVVNREEFFQQFNVFSEGQLGLMDWNNVVAAGGSVLAATHPPPPGPLRDFYHTLAYRSSDIDLFLYGLSEKAATEKVKQIYAAILLANPKVFAVRSLKAITFVSEFPYRKVQIVLRLYKTMAEVLHGFDVDACSVGFDGHTVWATNRAARAICKRYNVVDLTRRSPSYESRLFKYGKRGHALFVKGMRVDKIKPTLLNARINSFRVKRYAGLAKLILMDSIYRRFSMSLWGDYYERWNEGLVPNANGNHLDEPRRIHRQEHQEESDYTHMFIPYGPKWSRDRVRHHVHDYISAANEVYYRFNVCPHPQARIQPVVCGTIEHVLDTGVNTGEEEKVLFSHEEDMSLLHMKHVTGDQMWIKVNPGAQGTLLTGSFHPMNSSKEDWERDAFTS